jgi:hypothetical protein
MTGRKSALHLIIASAVLPACALDSQAGQSPIANDEPGSKFAAYADVSSTNRRGNIIVHYRNGTHSEIRINTQLMTSGVLALDVESTNGKPMLPMPPPTPDPSAEMIEIHSGEEWIQRYALEEMFDPSLPPGAYRVRVKLEGWSSNVCEVVVD